MITKEMKISTITARYPESIDIFFDFGMGCAGCPGAAFETIEQGAKKHGLSDDELYDLLDQLNEVAESFSEEEADEEDESDNNMDYEEDFADEDEE